MILTGANHRKEESSVAVTMNVLKVKYQGKIMTSTNRLLRALEYLIYLHICISLFQVNLNFATIDVNGIPYYPINEEGSVGVGVQARIPFGSWGGGYSDHVGVRYEL